MKITLEAARVNKHLTQQELADLMGVSRVTVQNWESGKTKMKPASLFMFCSITGTSEADIFLPSEYAKCVQEAEGDNENIHAVEKVL